MQVPINGAHMCSYLSPQNELQLQDLDEFDAQLQFKDAQRGRSSVVMWMEVLWMAGEPRLETVPVSFIEFCRLVPYMRKGITPVLKWKPYKQGTGYFVKPVNLDDKGEES